MFEEIEGETVGSYLTPNPKTPYWEILLVKILFSRWTGKNFFTPFDKEKRGKGVNLFKSIFSHYRFQDLTLILKMHIAIVICVLL